MVHDASLLGGPAQEELLLCPKRSALPGGGPTRRHKAQRALPLAHRGPDAGARSTLPPAGRALKLAGEEANRASSPHVGTEHLFLGLLRVSEGATAMVLGEVGP